MKQIFFSICIALFIFNIQAQTEGNLLLISDLEAKVQLDGEEKGRLQANQPFKISSTPGEHYLQIIPLNNEPEKNEIVVVESSKQKIIKYQFNVTKKSSEKLVADLNFPIPGMLAVGTWKQNNPNKNYEYPTFYYAFEKGDEVVIDLTMTNQKGTNLLHIETYPGKVKKFSNNTLTELHEHVIKIEERVILKFTIATNHAFNRNVLLKIRRRLANVDAENFNSNVSKKFNYKAIAIHEVLSNYVNSGSNASIGGKSRIVIPITLPPRTIEWYYKFSSTRDKAEVEQTAKGFKLAGELGNLLMGFTGMPGKATSIVVGQLTKPPGSNICDIFLLDYNNIANFEAKQDQFWQHITQGTQKNLKSGNVKINCCLEGQYYLGIRNPDGLYGIHTVLDVTAITVEEEWVMEGN